MNPRYFVTYRRWNGTVVETSTYPFGRFLDEISANRQARERFGASGSEILEVRQESVFEAARYKAYRFAIRLFRIVFAGVIAFFAYLWLGESTPKLGDIPLGEITLNMIFSALLYGAFVMGAVCVCWFLVFGDGPKDDR